MRTLCLVLFLVLFASACGQKGPLVLPKDKDKPEMTEEGTPKPRTDKK
jgi:predicted small lipoprotein YifL